MPHYPDSPDASLQSAIQHITADQDQPCRPEPDHSFDRYQVQSVQQQEKAQTDQDHSAGGKSILARADDAGELFDLLPRLPFAGRVVSLESHIEDEDSD